MSLVKMNLTVLARSNGVTIWNYNTIDDVGFINRAGYFDSASDMIRQGDMIIVNVDGVVEPIIFVISYLLTTGQGRVDVNNLDSGDDPLISVSFAHDRIGQQSP